MHSPNTQQPTADLLTTEEFASRHGVKPGSVRAALYKSKSYFGTTPIRMPNGRLRWPVPTLPSGPQD